MTVTIFTKNYNKQSVEKKKEWGTCTPCYVGDIHIAVHKNQQDWTLLPTSSTGTDVHI